MRLLTSALTAFLYVAPQPAVSVRQIIDVAANYNIRHSDETMRDCGAVDYDENSIFVSKKCSEEERRSSLIKSIDHAYRSLEQVPYRKEPEPSVGVTPDEFLDILLKNDLQHSYYMPVNGAAAGGLMMIFDGYVFNGVKAGRILDGKRNIAIHEFLHQLKPDMPHAELKRLAREIFRKLYLEE